MVREPGFLEEPHKSSGRTGAHGGTQWGESLLSRVDV